MIDQILFFYDRPPGGAQCCSHLNLSGRTEALPHKTKTISESSEKLKGSLWMGKSLRGIILPTGSSVHNYPHFFLFPHHLLLCGLTHLCAVRSAASPGLWGWVSGGEPLCTPYWGLPGPGAGVLCLERDVELASTGSRMSKGRRSLQMFP